MGLLQWLLCAVLASAVYAASSDEKVPSMHPINSPPVHVQEGDDALIMCVVRHAGNHTVMWKKYENGQNKVRFLTAGYVISTPDVRLSLLHDKDTDDKRIRTGDDVWVLAIKESRPSDTGMYICELNTDPVVRSFHPLNVLPRGLVPPDPNSKQYFDPNAVKIHNYTDCCVSSNVSQSCLGFCNIQSILDGNTGQEPENCEQDFPNIVKCMADGRNHVPCCIKEKVPDICQDVCRGEYTVITDNIKTHFSCSAYTEQTLACIVEGIEILPGAPQNVIVEPLTENQLNISWSPHSANTATVTGYKISLNPLKSFDAHLIDTTGTQAIDTKPEEYTAEANATSTIIDDLRPFTMYEVTITAVNKHGTSLPSDTIRALTMGPGTRREIFVHEPPPIPDIRQCCENKGVAHNVCINKLCDPTTASNIGVTDLMICAAWANDAFSCLADKKDHSPCCRRRGLPEPCLDLCSGNVTTIDYNYFKCLKFMPDLTNCLLQGYGVLPSAPKAFHLTNINTDFAIVHWSYPRTLGQTVQFYNLHYRVFTDEDSDYAFIGKIQSPYILEFLKPDTDYEVYVEGVNKHGVGEPSNRIIFKTQSRIIEELTEEALMYNMTACCEKVAVSDLCMPLCSYDASMGDLKNLAALCAQDFQKLLRCGVGGRNHGECCARRGVSAKCQPLCTGVIVDSLLSTAKNCIPFIGNIVQCFEEGTGILPGPIRELHATKIEGTNIHIQWVPPTEGSNITGYIVHYQKVDNTSMYEMPLKLSKQEEVYTTNTVLSNLEKGALYNIFVVAFNSHGTSLPSSILLINCTESSDFRGSSSVTSPPHSLAVSGHSATWVTISWQPPEFSHPEDIITYILYYKSNGNDSFASINCSVTSHTLERLSPNTQHIVYVVANSSNGKSLPSETLIAWTDPAYPAHVEPPTVHPINMVTEGSSMTILCIAVGAPIPTVSLYISGRLVRKEQTRHMVTVIHNVTRDMNYISCYADNGYGTPAQAFRKITISHTPTIQASGITMAVLGDSVTLQCNVAALPRPQMAFSKDAHGRDPVIQGPKYNIQLRNDTEEEAKYIMQLTISKITALDQGEYYCHAENAFGAAVQPVSVRIRNIASSHNITKCCIEQNVTSSCMDACSFYLDINAVIDKPQCIQDFDKLMKCAADGSDHRSCCIGMEVPRRCLDWCRGESLPAAKYCALSYTQHIIGCFQEGQDKLPGPPQNVKVFPSTLHTAKISWEPPTKNPHTVEMYRVFWRPLGARESQKMDTEKTELIIDNLAEGKTYECVVKAGNNLGTSTLTEPVKFTVGDKYVTSSLDGQSSNSGVAVGVVLACLLVAAILIVAVYLVRTKKVHLTWNQFIRNTKILGFKTQGGVAFENPSYLKEMNGDSATNTTPQNGVADNTNARMGVASVSGGTGWKQESLQVPQEVNPTLYEELKLGQDGAGFKRLKP